LKKYKQTTFTIEDPTRTPRFLPWSLVFLEMRNFLCASWHAFCHSKICLILSDQLKLHQNMNLLSDFECVIVTNHRQRIINFARLVGIVQDKGFNYVT